MEIRHSIVGSKHSIFLSFCDESASLGGQSNRKSVAALRVLLFPCGLNFRFSSFSCCRDVQYRREGDSRGKTPGPGPQGGP